MNTAYCCQRPSKSANSATSKSTASPSSSVLSKSNATTAPKSSVSNIYADLCVCAQEARCSCGARPARQCTCARATCENLMVPTQTCSCGMRQAYHCTCSRAPVENMSFLREGEVDFTYLRWNKKSKELTSKSFLFFFCSFVCFPSTSTSVHFFFFPRLAQPVFQHLSFYQHLGEFHRIRR